MKIKGEVRSSPEIKSKVSLHDSTIAVRQHSKCQHPGAVTSTLNGPVFDS